jgi:hypothetical protein
MQKTVLEWAQEKNQLFYDEKEYPLDRLMTEQEWDEAIQNGEKLVDWNGLNTAYRLNLLMSKEIPITNANLLNPEISPVTNPEEL